MVLRTLNGRELIRLVEGEGARHAVPRLRVHAKEQVEESKNPEFTVFRS